MFWRRRSQRDFEDEVQSHLDLEADRLRAQGVAASAAEFAARKKFGNVSATIDRLDAAQPLSWLFDIGKDVRHAIRTLRNARGFTIAVVLTLALGIGANSAMFTIVNAVLFRPLPYPESNRIVSMSRSDDGKDNGYLDDRTFRGLLAGGAPSLQSVAATDGTGQQVLMLPSGPVPVGLTSVTSQFFSVYGTTPLRGRSFTTADDEKGAPAVVILSEPFWRSTFNGDTAIIGRTIALGNTRHTVVGIMPALKTTSRPTDVWTPLQIGPPVGGSMWFFLVTGKLRPEATMEALRAEVNTVGKRLAPESSPKRIGRDGKLFWTTITLHDRRFGDSRRALMLLWGTVGVLLLVACANIANLSLARASRREREFALRMALGASRARIVRYVLAESMVLATAGAALGTLIATLSVGYFVKLSPGSVARAEGVRVDGVALIFTFVIAIATAVIFGLMPALRASRAGVSFTFMSGTPRATGGRGEQALRRTLVVAQLAAALVMLISAALVTKTLTNVTSIDAGFEPNNLTAIWPSLGRERYTPATAQQFFSDLAERLGRESDVRNVSFADAIPLNGVQATSMRVDFKTGKKHYADLVRVDSAYMTTVGAHLKSGRWLNDGDKMGAPTVAVVNEAFERDQFPGESALGRTPPSEGYTVVGVIRDIRQRGIEEPIRPTAYFPIAQEQRPGTMGLLLVRTAPGSSGLIERARKIVKEMDAAQLPPYMVSVRERWEASVAPRRFIAILLTTFAGLAALLAIVGLYGVLSYVVAQRTREIGIRVALGADADRVLRLVLGSGVVLIAVGVTIGIGAALFTVRLLRTMVYDMSIYDPWMFGASASLLIVVALVASWIPARRAAAVDPVTALRVE